jgi:methyltransferase (TIGR00027 family)
VAAASRSADGDGGGKRSVRSLNHVSDTALLVANMRAIETRRTRPLFTDPFAELFAKDRGGRIEPIRRRLLPSGAVIARTAILDNGVTRAVADDKITTVVNLGAGLDTRPYRLELPERLQWIEVDLPGILKYKESVLSGASPNCQLERRCVDLVDGAARRAFLSSLPGISTLFITEGLIPYFAPAVVDGLAQDLSSQAGSVLWWTHFVSPAALRWGNRFGGRKLASADASIKFAPEEGTTYFERFDWDTVESHSMWLEQRRLGREAWPMRLVWKLSSTRIRSRLNGLETLALLRHRSTS